MYEDTGRKILIVGKRGEPRYHPLYQNVPYIASLSEAKQHGLYTIQDAPGRRPYIDYPATLSHSENNGTLNNLHRWVWELNYQVSRAEIVFSDAEEELWSRDIPDWPYVVVEPNIKPKAPETKRWPFDNWQQLVNKVIPDVRFIQFIQGKQSHKLNNVVRLPSGDIRKAAYWVKHATCVVTSEGGLSHLAGAFNTKCVAFYGGYCHPSVIGYKNQRAVWINDPKILGVRIINDRIKESVRQVTVAKMENQLRLALSEIGMDKQLFVDIVPPID